MAKRRRQPCEQLEPEHVDWLIRMHGRAKWLRKLRADITRDMLKNFVRAVLLRAVAPMLGGAAAVKFLEWLFG